MKPVGVGFSLIKKSDLVRVDEQVSIVEGGPVKLLNVAAFMIHSAVHQAGPDVLCAAHSHSIHSRAFCALGKLLDIIIQDACSFHDDHALYTSFNGTMLVPHEGRTMTSALGNKKAALLQNHGLWTVGASVESAVFWFVSLEKCCQAQLMADTAARGRGGTTSKISDEDAASTYNTVGTEQAGRLSATPMFDAMQRECGDEVFRRCERALVLCSFTSC